MIDPMANLGGPQPGSQPQPGTGDSAEEEVFDFHAQQHNVQKMESIRSFMGIINGCCAGILGLTNSMGIVFFIFMHLVVSACLFMKIGGDLEKYRKGTGMAGFWLEGLQNCFMSYMLFWTLFYGLVYLF